jgi:hypothetical protein
MPLDAGVPNQFPAIPAFPRDPGAPSSAFPLDPARSRSIPLDLTGSGSGKLRAERTP